jgi:3-oxoacyl-[acyl-carrier-protein] synthase II
VIAGPRSIPAVVTGLGPITAIGCGRDAFWDALLAGRHGFGPITTCDTTRSPSKIGAEIPDFDLGRYLPRGRQLGRRMPRPVQFALAATSLALEDAGLESDSVDPRRVGVVVGTSTGNLIEGLPVRDRWVRGEARFGSDAAFHLFHQSAACMVSSIFDLRGPMQTVSTGCNAGLDALGQALRWIQRGEVDAVLVVGTDCELVPEILSMLCDSGSLTTRYNDDPGRASRPFDVARDGNVLGEGAAAVVLEAEPHARTRGARWYARLTGYAVRSAGARRRYSARAPAVDVDPSVRAFRATMEESGWRPSDVNVVNANGSSSVLYDRFEALALAEVFEEALPAVRVHSIKSALGQHGAGSSALQVVAACLAIDRGTVPPTINHERLDPACGRLRVVTRPEPLPGPNVVVHSIGLGGFYYSCGAFTAANPRNEEES